MKYLSWFGLAGVFCFGCDAPLGIQPAEPFCAENPQGTALPVSSQTSGDCLQIVCNARGEFEQVPLDDDIPTNDATSCVKKTCAAGKVTLTQVAATTCYGGPPNTENIGRCRAGTMMCVAGAASGECVGEVLPTQESCATPEDDDCDGSVNEEGPDCGCMPGETRACYSGPVNTENVGVCHAGTQTCNASGNGFGPCTGEATPLPDVCDPNDADENCDGIAECTGQTATVKVIGSKAGDETLWSLVVDEQNHVIISGWDSGDSELGLGAGPFLAKFDPAGTLQWAKKFTNGSMSNAVLTTDPMGAIWLAGTTGAVGGGPASAVVYDGVTISGNGAEVYVFLLKISGQDGSLLAKTNSTGGLALGRGITADASGNVFVTGEYQGTTAFGNQTLGCCGGAYVANVQSNGTTAWATNFGTAGGTIGSSVAVRAQEPPLVMGSFAPTLDLGGIKLMSQQGFVDLFVGSIDKTTGMPLGGVSFGSPALDRGSMVLGATGTRWLVGATAGDIDFGCGPHAHADKEDAFIAAIDANGKCISSRLCAGLSNQAASFVAVDAQGCAAVLGSFGGPTECDGQVLTPKSMEDVFVANYGPDGSFRWMRQFGSLNGSIAANGIASTADGHVWIAGTIMGNTEFGSTMTKDIFLAELLP